MVPRGRARSEFSRVIRICRYFSLSTLTCVECEQSTLVPLLPLNHLYTCTTCVCAGCSTAVCPFCLLCQIVLFPLLLEGKPFLGRACSSSVTLNLLYWHVLSSWKYKLEYWFTQTLDLDLQEFIQHRVTPRSCHCNPHKIRPTRWGFGQKKISDLGLIFDSGKYPGQCKPETSRDDNFENLCILPHDKVSICDADQRGIHTLFLKCATPIRVNL